MHQLDVLLKIELIHEILISRIVFNIEILIWSRVAWRLIYIFLF